jgi:DNA-directed RNA polymerase specialized sigma24 family protein
VRVLGQLRRGQGPTGSFRPYLIAAVRNVAVDAWRGTLGRELPTGESWAVAVGGEASTDPQDEIEIRFAVQRVMADLPPQWRYILWRLDHQGDTPAGVASEVGASAQAVSALAYRARRAFRGAYQELGLRDAVAGDDPDAAVAPHPRALRYEETATAICS